MLILSYPFTAHYRAMRFFSMRYFISSAMIGWLVLSAAALAGEMPVEMNENQLIKILAKKLGAQSETRHAYFVNGKKYFIRVDIETKHYVIEVGLDKRSSLDSIQQASFAAQISGKKPKIIILDTDGREGRFEYRIRIAAQKLGMAYQSIPARRLKKLLTKYSTKYSF